MGQEVLALVFTAVAGYLLGSINWSIILTWFFKSYIRFCYTFLAGTAYSKFHTHYRHTHNNKEKYIN